MHYTAQHGQVLKDTGVKMIKRPNPVYMTQTQTDGTVETSEGVLSYKAGDFIAYDPISGHVWPVKASYVEQHYDKAPESEA